MSAYEAQMSRGLSIGMHSAVLRNWLCSGTQKLALCATFFWWEYLTLKSCTCSTGATGIGAPAAGLAATQAAGLAALLVEGSARGWAALGAGLAGGPCGKQLWQVAFPLTGWGPRELGWVVGVLAHGRRTSVL